ncbi:MAG: hypothetical protein Q9193_001622 [Seirophora villosa]
MPTVASQSARVTQNPGRHRIPKEKETDGPSLATIIARLLDDFPEPQALSPAHSTSQTSEGGPYLPTPPESQDGGDECDLTDLAYPIHPRALSQCRLTPLPHHRGREPDFRTYGPPTPQSASTSSPDRYISVRHNSQDPSRSFRLGKPPHLLSDAEKLLRNDSATPDPFVSGSPRRPPHLNLEVVGAVWNIGGGVSHPHGPVQGVSDGRGGLIGSGTNAPLYTAKFLEKGGSEEDRETFEDRLAAALDIDRTRRTLNFTRPQARQRRASGTKRKREDFPSRTQWKYGGWTREGDISSAQKSAKKEAKPVPTVPFRVLDAPQLRDDYYCSVLAYCRTSRTLAVGLSHKVYLWSEALGVQYPRMDETVRRTGYVTSLSFSSAEGGHSILAIGRNSGHVSLWSLFDEGTRFESQQPNAVACLAFKPVTSRRMSAKFGTSVATEELLVGDEVGNVYYYAVEWVENLKVDIHGWHGSMSLVAKINVHNQQICGLAWSPDGNFFATGANDNACCLFVVKDILTPPGTPSHRPQNHREPLKPRPSGHGLPDSISSEAFHQRFSSLLSHSNDFIEAPPVSLAERGVSNPFIFRAIPGQNGILSIGEGRQKHKWIHSAAIKAIAFCPWQPGLLATGGGSNDRAIHFYHAFSGACLATIDVQAQVTSLIWSTSRHEIAATFGYAQPEHPYRIAVFSWPDCRQVVAIPWANEMRALHAIPYPGGPNEKGKKSREGEAWWSRTNEEGCIVVACSDESVKFHEVWTGRKKSMGVGAGLLGGSDILESLEGFDKEDKMIIR